MIWWVALPAATTQLAKKYSIECFKEARWLIKSLRDLSLKKTNLAETRFHRIQFQNGPQVDVGLARARFHLDGEVAGDQFRGGRQSVAKLDRVQVLRDIVIQ